MHIRVPLKVRLRRIVPVALMVLASLLIVGSSATPKTTNALIDWQANGWNEVALSGTTTCGLSTNTIYCWGSSEVGKSNVTRYSNPKVYDHAGAFTGKSLSNLVAGAEHFCVLADGSPYCWGKNDFGQLGNGSNTYSATPVKVDTTGVLTGKTVSYIAGGPAETCAIADGKAYCWGLNTDGQLGNNSTTHSNIPVAVDASSALAGKTVTDIAIGSNNACAVASGKAYCWGDNYYGQVGDSTHTQRLVPVAVSTSGYLNGKTLTHISAGSGFACTTTVSAVYCWGAGGNYALGTGTTNSSDVPIPVDLSTGISGKTISAIQSVSGETCVIASLNEFCWGGNNTGQMGTGSGSPSFAPSPVPINQGSLAGQQISYARQGNNTSCAIAANGKLSCWGQQLFGLLGNGQNDFYQIFAPNEVVALLPSVSNIVNAKQYIDDQTSATQITVDGTDFIYGPKLAVTIGGQPAQVSYFTDTRLYVTAPKIQTPGYYDMHISNGDGGEVDAPNAIQYVYYEPTVDSISPASAMIGETNRFVSINGSNFDNLTTVSIGGVQADILSRSSSTLTFTAPVSNTAGKVDVVVHNKYTSTTITDGFEYTPQPTPQIDSISPASAMIGETNRFVSINGSNFDDVTTVSIGGVEADVISRSSSTIFVTAPVSNTAGKVDVIVRNMYTSTTITDGFEYTPQPTPQIDSISRSSGYVNGGETVDIYGNNFVQGASVFFGSNAATVLEVASSYITVTVPAGNVGTVDVSVKNPFSETTTFPNMYQYVPIPGPSINSISQSSGLVSGGDYVYIYGNAMGPGSTVTFGGKTATVNDPTSSYIGVYVPSSTSAGLVDVVVTRPDGQKATLYDGYEYLPVPVPQIDSITPASGPYSGGGVLTITGSQFRSNLTVQIGGKNAVIYSISETEIMVQVPSSTIGFADVSVTNPGSETGTLANGYEYTQLPAPVVNTINPSAGSINGDDSIGISGYNFGDDPEVRIGGALATLQYHDGFYISLLTPKGTLGKTDITITRPDGASTTISDGFEYMLPNPVFASSTTKDFMTRSGGNLKLYGSSFSADTIIRLDGTVLTSASYVAPYLMNLQIPAGLAVGPHTLSAENPDGSTSELTNAFSVYAVQALPSTYLGQISSNGTNEDQLVNPQMIDIDDNGDIYVAEAFANTVKVFKKDGTYVRSIDVNGPGNDLYKYLGSVRIGPDGNIYALESNNSRVKVFAKDGTFIRQWGSDGGADDQFGYSENITLDKQGNVYVGQCGYDQIQGVSLGTVKEYSSTGTFIREIGTKGNGGPGTLDCTYGLAITDDGTLYVYDSQYYNDSNFSHVLVYAADGTYLREFSAYGGQGGTIDFAEDLAIDKLGNIYVVDSDNDRVQVFDKDETYLGQIGTFGNGPGQFDYPNSIAFDADNNIYVVDGNNARIQVFKLGATISNEPTIPVVSTPAVTKPVTNAPAALATIADAVSTRIEAVSEPAIDVSDTPAVADKAPQIKSDANTDNSEQAKNTTETQKTKTPLKAVANAIGTLVATVATVIAEKPVVAVSVAAVGAGGIGWAWWLLFLKP